MAHEARASLAGAQRLVIAREGASNSGAKQTRMAKVLLLQFDTDPACAERRDILAKTGLAVVEAEPRWPTFFDVVTAQRPDVIVIAASLIPSHAYEAARYLGDGFNTRNIPVLLVDVAPRDRASASSSAPQATIIDRGGLAASVSNAITSSSVPPAKR